MKRKIIGIFILILFISCIAIVKEKKINVNNKTDHSDKKSSPISVDNYDEEAKIQERYLNSIYAQVDDMIASNNLDGAEKLLIKASSRYPDIELNEKISNVRVLKQVAIDQKIVELESTAKNKMDSHDWEGAKADYVQLYKISNNDERYSVMLQSLKDIAERTSISEAEEYAKQGNYDDAINVLVEAKTIVEDTTKIDEILEKIENCAPVPMLRDGTTIYNIATEESGDCHFEEWINATANDGNQYSGFGMSGTQGRGLDSIGGYFMESGIQTCSRTYNLEDYDTIRGLLVLKQECKNTKCKMYLQIYSDDKLLFTSEYLTSESLPIPIEVDISQGKKVKLVWCSTYPEDDGGWFYDNYSFAFVNVNVSKKYCE